MKRFFLLFLITCVCALVGGAGCTNVLNREPVDFISADNALSTQQGVERTLIGAYDILGSDRLYGGQAQYLAELVGDGGAIRYAGSSWMLTEFWRKGMSSWNGMIGGLWYDCYTTINRANMVLSAVDKVAPADKNRIEGEALFLRGIAYYTLVTSFARPHSAGNTTTNLGVPIILTPTFTVENNNNPSRNTVAEVYTQILQDLTRAEQLLPATPGNVVAHKHLAAGILSRVYLQQENYALARDAANRVIESGLYRLQNDFPSVFNSTLNSYSNEMLFSIRVTNQDGVNALNRVFASPQAEGNGDIVIESTHFIQYDTTDTRRRFFTTIGNRTYTNKFNGRIQNVPVLRLAELYLTRAECNQRLGTAVGATPLADYRRVRSRAIPTLPAMASVTLDNILAERLTELAFEGQLLHDLKRLRRTISIGTTSYPFTHPKLICPIPLRDILANPNMVQNETY